MDVPCEDAVTVVDGHTAPAGSEMRMVIDSVEEVVSAFFCGDDSENSSHRCVSLNYARKYTAFP